MLLLFLAVFATTLAYAADKEKPVERIYPVFPPAPRNQEPADVRGEIVRLL